MPLSMPHYILQNPGCFTPCGGPDTDRSAFELEQNVVCQIQSGGFLENLMSFSEYMNFKGFVKS